MKTKNWLQKHQQDIYVKKAKKEGYLTRASFKLIEIEKKFKFISNSNHILELGSSPGGWSQVICNINKKATIHAFDILEMKFKHSHHTFEVIGGWVGMSMNEAVIVWRREFKLLSDSIHIQYFN